MQCTNNFGKEGANSSSKNEGPDHVYDSSIEGAVLRLRRMNLSASGNKVELIAKLNEADSSGQWMIDAEAIVSETGESSGDVAMAQDIGISTRRPRSPTEFSILRERERDLESRERELLQREIELMRRENEQLRSMVQSASGTSTSAAMAKVSLTNLKEILSSFDGEKGS